MKKTVELKQDFYQFFDRLGEGVYYNYSVEYDWDDIMQNNFNEHNFKIIPGGISSSHDKYFAQYRINKAEWEKEMVDYLLSPKNDMTFEYFFDKLSGDQQEEYQSKW
jgi:hypothetical protein